MSQARSTEARLPCPLQRGPRVFPAPTWQHTWLLQYSYFYAWYLLVVFALLKFFIYPVGIKFLFEKLLKKTACFCFLVKAFLKSNLKYLVLTEHALLHSAEKYFCLMFCSAGWTCTVCGQNWPQLEARAWSSQLGGLVCITLPLPSARQSNPPCPGQSAVRTVMWQRKATIGFDWIVAAWRRVSDTMDVLFLLLTAYISLFMFLFQAQVRNRRICIALLE